MYLGEGESAQVLNEANAIPCSQKTETSRDSDLLIPWRCWRCELWCCEFRSNDATDHASNTSVKEQSLKPDRRESCSAAVNKVCIQKKKLRYLPYTLFSQHSSSQPPHQPFGLTSTPSYSLASMYCSVLSKCFLGLSSPLTFSVVLRLLWISSIKPLMYLVVTASFSWSK